MPRRLSSAEVGRLRIDHGFAPPAGPVVIVPADRREIPVGTIISIIKQSGLDRDLFR